MIRRRAVITHAPCMTTHSHARAMHALHGELVRRRRCRAHRPAPRRHRSASPTGETQGGTQGGARSGVIAFTSTPFSRSAAATSAEDADASPTAEQQPAAAHLGDPLDRRCGAPLAMCAPIVQSVDQPLALDRIEHRERGGGDRRTAPERARAAAALSLLALSPTSSATSAPIGRPGAETLRKADRVRAARRGAGTRTTLRACRSPSAPRRAPAARRGENAQGAGLGQVLRRHRPDAPLSLHGLDEHRRGLRPDGRSAAPRCTVRRHVAEAGQGPARTGRACLRWPALRPASRACARGNDRSRHTISCSAAPPRMPPRRLASSTSTPRSPRRPSCRRRHARIPPACGAARRARWRAPTSTGWRHARGGMPARRERGGLERDARDRASTRRGRRPGRGTPSPARPRRVQLGTAHERERALGVRRKAARPRRARRQPVAHAVTSVPPRPIQTRATPPTARHRTPRASAASRRSRSREER